MPKFGTYDSITNPDGTETFVVKKGLDTKVVSLDAIKTFSGSSSSIPAGASSGSPELSIVEPSLIGGTPGFFELSLPTSRVFVTDSNPPNTPALRTPISRLIANNGMNTDGSVVVGNTLIPSVVDIIFDRHVALLVDPLNNGNIRSALSEFQYEVKRGESIRFVHDGTNYVIAESRSGYVDFETIGDTTLASNYIIASKPRIEIDLTGVKTLKNIYTAKGWDEQVRVDTEEISPSVLYIKPKGFNLSVDVGSGSNIIDQNGNSTVEPTEVLMLVNFGENWHVVNTNI